MNCSHSRELHRRAFVAGLLGTAAAASATGRVPIRKARVTKLFKSPDGHPNALEATDAGLWVGEQVTDNAYLLDWRTGEVLKKVTTESSNTSGLAYGGGYLWMGANGGPLGRFPRPDEPRHGRIVKVDVETGRTVGVFRIPDEGGVHGVMYADDSLWLTCFKWNVVARLDPETLKVQHKIPLHLSRPHGLAWDPPGIGVGYSNDYFFLKRIVPRLTRKSTCASRTRSVCGPHCDRAQRRARVRQVKAAISAASARAPVAGSGTTLIETSSMYCSPSSLGKKPI
jgi:streptogramin lyase